MICTKISNQSHYLDIAIAQVARKVLKVETAKAKAQRVQRRVQIAQKAPKVAKKAKSTAPVIQAAVKKMKSQM